MNIIAINGSPRKNWNTATLLKKALEGSKSQGATTALIHLNDELLVTSVGKKDFLRVCQVCKYDQLKKSRALLDNRRKSDNL